MLKIAHPLLKSIDPSAQAFASELPRLLHTLTLKPRDFFSGDSSVGCDQPVAALVTLGKVPSKAIEVTRLLYGFYVDESSACSV